MSTNYIKVIEFNRSFGIFVSETPLPDIFVTNPKLTDLRYSLISEEVGELNEAYDQKDIIEVIDALSDILYVVYGAGASFGIELDTNFKLAISEITSIDFDVHISNLSNYHAVKYYLEKFTNYEIPNTISKDFLNNNFLKTKETINTTLSNLKISIDKKEFEAVSNHLLRLLYYTYTLGIIMGVDLDKSYDIVHSSNMSKLCKNEAEAKETVAWYLKNESRYDSPSYRKSYDDKNWVIFNRSTGKILKSINYNPAKFDSML